MKKLIVVVVALIAFGNVAVSQTKKVDQNQTKVETAKVIVMVNTATWCPVCKANGSRVKQNVISKYLNNNKCEIVVNDLSDEDTKATSSEKCNKAGILNVANNNKSTGIIYFINSITKEVIAQISVSKTDEEIIKAFEDAISKV